MADLWIIRPPPRPVAGQLKEAAAKILADDERRRARTLGAAERGEYVAFRLALRAILKHYRPGLADGAVFWRGPHGKPYLDGGPEFSFSATAGLALLAVSDDGPVGVDVERVRDISFAAMALERAPGLAAYLDHDPARPDNRTLAFLRAWTRLEAVLKREGLALGPALGDLNAAAIPAHMHARAPEPEAAEVSDVDVGHGFVAACAHASGVRLALKPFDWAGWQEDGAG